MGAPNVANPPAAGRRGPASGWALPSAIWKTVLARVFVVQQTCCPAPHALLRVEHIVLLLIEEDGRIDVGVVDVSARGNPTPEIKHFRERNELPPLEIKSAAVEVMIITWGLRGWLALDVRRLVLLLGEDPCDFFRKQLPFLSWRAQA